MFDVQEDEAAATIAPMRQGQRPTRRSALKVIEQRVRALPDGSLAVVGLVVGLLGVGELAAGGGLELEAAAPNSKKSSTPPPLRRLETAPGSVDS